MYTFKFVSDCLDCTFSPYFEDRLGSLPPLGILPHFGLGWNTLKSRMGPLLQVILFISNVFH